MKPESIAAALLCALAMALAAAGNAQACPIPVFQYALEYWEADAYRAVVRHNGKLTEEQREAIDLLRDEGIEGERRVNVQVQVRDLSEDAAVPAAYQNLPHLEVLYPLVTNIREPVWSGPLTREAVNALLDSPARQKIATLLLDRKAAVWVMLESGNRAADREVEQTLEQELARLEQVLRVPDAGGYGLEQMGIHTDISFDVVRVSRDDPAEEMFVRMLLQSERDLAEFDDETPMVFPVYGRGIILYALVGRGINAWTLADAGEFLTGSCSCQVKADNPGTDLLMAVRWGDHVEAKSYTGIPGPVGAGGFIDRLETAEGELSE